MSLQIDRRMKFSNMGRIIFKISDGGRRTNGRRSKMMYNREVKGGWVGGWGVYYYLEFPQWLQMTIIKKGTWFVLFAIISKFYLIYLLKYTNVVLNLHCQGLLIVADFNWYEVSYIILSSSSGENESIFVIFCVYFWY